MRIVIRAKCAVMIDAGYALARSLVPARDLRKKDNLILMGRESRASLTEGTYGLAAAFSP
ncbi:MAG: hypothetical protein ABID54_12535 [Pseudomonadota bacterium]